ncbi:MAG: response regulator [Acidobacteriota bacterium]
MIKKKETTEKHVLVVDDEPQLLELMSMCLEREGFQVQTAADGQQALECLKGNQYDVIVIDILMPGMGGKQLYQRMASDPVLRKYLDRIIVVSGDAFNEDTQSFIEDNCLAWLSKPFLLREFKEKVRRVGCLESPGAR